MVQQTQLAPPAVFNKAFNNGQSDTASVPSFMPSVSRFGLDTEPVSKMIATDHDWGFQFTILDHLIEGQTGDMTLTQT